MSQKTGGFERTPRAPSQTGSADLHSRTGDLPKTGDLPSKTGDLKTGDLKTGDLGHKTGDLRTGDIKTGDISRRGDFTDPLAPKVAAWLLRLSKAAKSLTLYSAENRTFLTHLENAQAALTEVLAVQPELTLAVREDRFLFNGDTVYETVDLQHGLPAILHRNAFRRITFIAGFPPTEMVHLLRAIFTDLNGKEYVEEDLVSLLWRLDLAHFRYLTIDILALDPKAAASDSEREEIERIQHDLESILAALYKTDGSDADVLHTASITTEDLQALQEARTGPSEDLDLLDAVTGRALSDADPVELGKLKKHHAEDSSIPQSLRLLSVWKDRLFSATSTVALADTKKLMLELVDTLLLAGNIEPVSALVRALRHAGPREVARDMLGEIGSEPRILLALKKLESGQDVSALSALIRALDAEAVTGLLGALHSLGEPAHRRYVCQAIAEGPPPEPGALQVHMDRATWFVAKDLLTLAANYPPAEVEDLVKVAVKHENPKVREQGVGMLRKLDGHGVDRMLVHAMDDADVNVRLVALRTAAARESNEALSVVERKLDHLETLETEEMQLVLAAYARIARARSIARLGKLLNPGLFKSFTNVDVPMGAASALATIGGSAAIAELEKGAGSLNPKIRSTCKHLLSRDLKEVREARPREKSSITGAAKRREDET